MTKGVSTAKKSRFKSKYSYQLKHVFLGLEEINKYLFYAIDHNFDEEEKKAFDCLDKVLFQYKLYLLDHAKTLAEVKKEIKKFLSNKNGCPTFLYTLFMEVENDIMDTELYELLPKFLKSKKELTHIF